jgi:hypothetical protein
MPSSLKLPAIPAGSFMYSFTMALSISRIKAVMHLISTRRLSLRYLSASFLLLVGCMFLLSQRASAVYVPDPGPKGESFGVEFKIDGPPPTQGATITSPTNGQSFTDLPVTVTGTCPNELLVKVLINDVLAGSAFCTNGRFSMPVSLYTGQNDIKAYVFDNLDQEGPVSNTVTVTFNNASFSAFGTLITLTSQYARRAASPGSTLTWPLILSGGTGPYAFSIDWGDGTSPQLKSVAFPGNVDIDHIYKKAGVYQLVVKATDVNGVSAFLQLTAVATGKPAAGVTVEDKNDGGINTIQRILLWQPAAVLLALMIPTFWLGRRYELSELRKQIERDAAKYTS